MKLKWSKREKRYELVFPKGATAENADRITFKMQLISWRDRTEIMDNMAVMEDGKTRFLAGMQEEMKLRFSVKGWENICDEDGGPIPFSDDTMFDLLAMPEMADARKMLLADIDKRNGIELKTEKNS